MKAYVLITLVSFTAASLLAADGSQPPTGAPVAAPAASPAPKAPATPEPAAPAAAKESATPSANDTMTQPAAASGDTKIAGLACGTAVENRELVGASASFDGPVARVYCWNRVTAASVPSLIRHVWYSDGAKTFEVPLNIKVSPMRTWSYRDATAGSWKVEAVDETGAVLAATEFSVGGAPSQ